MTAEENTMTNDSSKHDHGVIGSIIELGAATTKMTIDQVQNAFTALTNPSAAIDHVKDTLHALSDAMNHTSSGGHSRSVNHENDMRGGRSGREHVGTASDLDSSAYSESSSSPYAQSSHSSSSYGSSWTFTGRSTPRTINRRKS